MKRRGKQGRATRGSGGEGQNGETPVLRGGEDHLSRSWAALAPGIEVDPARVLLASYGHPSTDLRDAGMARMARSADSGAAFAPEERVKTEGLKDLARSMCMMRARIHSGNVYFAFRTAVDNIRDLLWSEEQLRKIPPLEFKNRAVIALGP